MQPLFGTVVISIDFNQTTLNSDPKQRLLVEACKRGERTAQYQLYHQYHKAMYNTCLRMLKIEADAEDAMQNAFIDVFTKLESFRYESTIGAWIKRIVVNTCINHLKKRKLLLSEWDERIPEPETTAPDLDVQDYQVGKIRSAIQELPDGYRTVFSLYLFEGYDHAEIGEILNISEATSKSQFSRAKQKVRELLSK